MAAKLTNHRVDELLQTRSIQRIGAVLSFHKPICWKCDSCTHEWMATPNNVLNRSTGCPECRLANIKTRNKQNTLTTDEFIKKAGAVHGDKYDYSKVVYTKSQTPVVIGCVEHGWFEQTPNTHLNGSGCKLCGYNPVALINTTRQQAAATTFIERASVKHNNAYDYSLTEYISRTTPITITCHTHGVFSKTPREHLAGVGCPQCTKASQGGHYTLSTFNARPSLKQKAAHLYCVQLTDTDGTIFVKVGITRRTTLRDRLAAYSDMGCVVVKVVSNIPLYHAFLVEQNMLQTFSESRYTPQKYFSGYTECLKYSVTELTNYLDYIESSIHGSHS